MKNKIKNRFQIDINSLIYIFLILSPIFDNITGIFLLNGKTSNLSSILKATTLFLCMIQIVIYNKYKIKELEYIILGFILIMLHLIFTTIYKKNGLGYNINVTIRLLNFWVIYKYLKTIKCFNTHSLMTFYSWFYPMSLFIPTLLGIGYHTYKIDSIGYKGFYYSGNEISIIMIIFIAYSFNNIIEKKKNINFINFLFNIFCSLLIGTKSIIIAIVIIMFIYYLRIIKKSNLFKRTLNILTILLFLFVCYVFCKDYLNSLFQIWVFRFAKVDNQWFSFLLSNRNLKLYEVFQIINSEGVAFLLFGGGAYYFVIEKGITIEMDFFDLLSWYGILLTSYFSMLIIHFIIIAKKNMSIIQRTLIYCIVLLSFWAGHVLFAPPVSIILAVYMYDAEKKKWSDIVKLCRK